MESISKFIKIDYEHWDRCDIYEEYRDVTFCITVDLDVTHYIEKYKHHVKFYPFMNYIVAKVVNSDPAYRMADHDGVGYYEVMHPLYTLLRKNNLFTHKYTLYNEDFVTFYHDFLRDKAIGEASDKLYSDGCRPLGTVSTSTLPSTVFNSLSIAYDMTDVKGYSPFTTFGRYYEKNGRWYCPVATQFFHGVNDGYHAERYYKAMQAAIDSFEVDVDRI